MSQLNEMERWLDIPGYEGLYQASNFGRIKRLGNTPHCLRDRMLAPRAHAGGYQTVSLCVNSKAKSYLIHRLIALTFIGKPTELDEVNHKDGDKTNNRVGNLEYVTDSGNKFHAYRTLGRSVVVTGGAKGEANHSAKLTEGQVRQIRAMYDNGVPNCELARQFNVPPSRITRIVKRQQWKHVR